MHLSQFRPLFGALVLASASCRDAATAPQAAARVVPAASSLRAYTPALVTAAPGTATIAVPAVIVLDQAGVPMSGVAVSFAVVDGSGSVSESGAVSDAEGVASSGSWTLGPTAGQNTLRASVTASLPIAPVFFTAIGIVKPADNSTYNLTAMGVTPLPVTQCCNYYSLLYARPVQDTVPYTTIAGRFVLTSDSTFTSVHLVAVADSTGVFHVDSTLSLVQGAYVRVSASTIHFYSGSELFATGTTNGDILGIALEEGWPGYFDETYVASQPQRSASRATPGRASVRKPQ